MANDIGMHWRHWMNHLKLKAFNYLNLNIIVYTEYVINIEHEALVLYQELCPALSVTTWHTCDRADL